MATPKSSKPADEQNIAVTESAAAPRPRLGEVVNVKAPKDTHLINGETGTYFTPGKATPQTVTITTLRRLEDGDLFLA